MRDKEILEYREARDVLSVLELQLGQEVEKWRDWSKDHIEVEAGRAVITSGANYLMQEPAGQDFIKRSLARHLYGDFGDLKHYEDWQENIITVWTTEGRVLSRYKAPNTTTETLEDIYIITEGIGSSEYHHTTIMLVGEY